MKQLRLIIYSVLFVNIFQQQFVQGQTAPADIEYVIGGGGSFASNANAEFAMAINPQVAFSAIPAAAEFTVIMYIPTSQVTGNEGFTILDDATNGGNINYQGPGFAHSDGNTYYSFVYSGTGINLSSFGTGSFQLIFSVDVANGNPSAVWNIADASSDLYADFNIRSALNVSGFNELTLMASAPLPVELEYFRATALDEKCLLSWQTASERDNAGFEIEHSIDGRAWNVLDFVEGHGTTAESNDYSYLHQQPKSGNNYYRLKQIDSDGEFEYSSVEVVKWANAALKVHLFPNPASDVLNVQVQEEYNEGTYQLFNSVGQLVKRDVLNGDHLMQVQLSNLPKGNYLIRLQIDGKQELHPILCQ